MNTTVNSTIQQYCGILRTIISHLLWLPFYKVHQIFSSWFILCSKQTMQPVKLQSNDTGSRLLLMEYINFYIVANTECSSLVSFKWHEPACACISSEDVLWFSQNEQRDWEHSLLSQTLLQPPWPLYKQSKFGQSVVQKPNLSWELNEWHGRRVQWPAVMKRAESEVALRLECGCD